MQVSRTKELFDASAASHIAPDTQSATQRRLAGVKCTQDSFKCIKSHLIGAKEFFQQFEPKFQCIFLLGRTENKEPSSQDICFYDIYLTYKLSHHLLSSGLMRETLTDYMSKMHVRKFTRRYARRIHQDKCQDICQRKYLHASMCVEII